MVPSASIYPNGPPARLNHVNVKVHVGGQAGSTCTDGHVSHTGTMFFPEATPAGIGIAGEVK